MECMNKQSVDDRWAMWAKMAFDLSQTSPIENGEAFEKLHRNYLDKYIEQKPFSAVEARADFLFCDAFDPIK